MESKAEKLEAKMEDFLGKLSRDKSGKAYLARTIRRGCKTGSWLSSFPSFVNGTVLGCQEFRDALCWRYGISCTLPKSCDGCGKAFDFEHSQKCLVGGMVHRRHNAVRDELIDLF